jgi:hypothetical protein
MPAVASLDELKAVEGDLNNLRSSHPEAYKNFAELFKKHRKVGYKNVCKLLLGEVTPEKLKGMI